MTGRWPRRTTCWASRSPHLAAPKHVQTTSPNRLQLICMKTAWQSRLKETPGFRRIAIQAITTPTACQTQSHPHLLGLRISARQNRQKLRLRDLPCHPRHRTRTAILVTDPVGLVILVLTASQNTLIESGPTVSLITHNILAECPGGTKGIAMFTGSATATHLPINQRLGTQHIRARETVNLKKMLALSISLDRSTARWMLRITPPERTFLDSLNMCITSQESSSSRLCHRTDTGDMVHPIPVLGVVSCQWYPRHRIFPRQPSRATNYWRRS